MSRGRRYTEQEIRTLFERAAERQEQARRAEAASEAGLSLDELQRIGKSAGIDPEHVAAAAGDLEGADPARAADVRWGVPAEVRQTRLLSGLVSDEAWEQMVAELRHTYGEAGVAGQVGRVREWRSASGSEKDAVHVTITPEGGGSRIAVAQRMENQQNEVREGVVAITAMVIALAILLFVGDFPAHYPWMIPLGIGGLGYGGFGGYWLWLRRHARRQEEEFRALADRLELISRKAASDEGAQRAELVETSRIDLDAVPDASAGRSAPSRNRTRS
jgi:hypothetical protein